MARATTADKVRKYAGSGKDVEVTLFDDRVYAGLLVSFEDNGRTLFKVLNGKRGRPARFAAEDVDKVVLSK